MIADKLARAIEIAKAVRLSATRYAIPELTQLNGWHATSEEGVIRSVYDEDAPDELYVEMPGWWTPERQYAWKRSAAPAGEGGNNRYPDTLEGRFAAAHAGHAIKRITADLETGEEVATES